MPCESHRSPLKPLWAFNDLTGTPSGSMRRPLGVYDAQKINQQIISEPRLPLRTLTSAEVWEYNARRPLMLTEAHRFRIPFVD